MVRSAASHGQRRWETVAAAVALALLIGGCGTRDLESESTMATAPQSTELTPPCETGLRVSSDGEDYPSVDALTRTSDVVVVGTVAEQRCVSGAALGGSAMPYLVSEVAVQEVLIGDDEMPVEDLTVVQLPGEQEASTPLATGDQVVLFLSREEPGEPELQEALGEHWTPVGWDSGVADVDGGTLSFRGGVMHGEKVAVADLTEDRSR